MKLILSIILINLSQLLTCQTIEVTYEYSVKSNLLNKFVTFPAILDYDNTSKLYMVDFSFDKKYDVADNVFLSKNKFKYILYSKKDQKTLIFDNLQEKNYLFEDNYIFEWTPTNEKKMVENVELNKATTTFRGRNYIIWYSKNNKFKVGPWKFNNLPGLVYEASDDSEEFHWNLKYYKIVKASVKNPIIQTGELKILPYKDYVKLKYGLSPELEAALKQNPNNSMFEQERDGLEIKFEWE